MKELRSKSPGKRVVGDPAHTPCRLLFCASRVSEFSTWRFSAPGLGLEKSLWDSSLGKIGGRPATAIREKILLCNSLYCMKIRVNTANLTSEQVKFLTQLGEFRDEQTWEAECDPDEFQEAVKLLKRAGVDDVFVQFGE
jgi:hypothetical protein